MIELLLDTIVFLGSNEVQNVLTLVGESAVKNLENHGTFHTRSGTADHQNSG